MTKCSQSFRSRPLSACPQGRRRCLWWPQNIHRPWRRRWGHPWPSWTRPEACLLPHRGTVSRVLVQSFKDYYHLGELEILSDLPKLEGVIGDSFHPGYKGFTVFPQNEDHNGGERFTWAGPTCSWALWCPLAPRVILGIAGGTPL